MQRTWLVIIAFVFFAACNEGGSVHGDLKYVQDECSRVDGTIESEVVQSASNFFEKEVGVRVFDVRVGRVSKCEENYVVPFSARTDGIKTPRVWYVEKNIETGAYELMRPM